MEAKKDLVEYEAKDGQQITLSFDIIRKYLVQGHPEFVTVQELMYFMGICKSRALNPFAKDCYLIKFSQKDGAAIVTSIDYFRKRSKAQKDCKGWSCGIIVQRNEKIVYSNGLMLESDILLGGWFEAQPEGWEKSFKKEVNLKGYIKRKVDGSVTRFWSKENQPSQIAKVAESQGLRSLWPDEFQQLYTPEEVGEGDMFKAAEEMVKSETADLNEKIKQPASPDEQKTDIYEVQEVKPDSEEKPESEPSPDEGNTKPEYSPFVQQFIKLRKGDGVKTGLGPAILKNKAAIQAAPPEDQEIIKGKFYTLYGANVSYPLDPPGEKETKTEDKSDPSSKADEETDQQRMLQLADGAELVDFAGKKMVIVKCPIRDDKPTEKWCSRCNDREGCDSWKDYDAWKLG